MFSETLDRKNENGHAITLLRITKSHCCARDASLRCPLKKMCRADVFFQHLSTVLGEAFRSVGNLFLLALLAGEDTRTTISPFCIELIYKSE